MRAWMMLVALAGLAVHTVIPVMADAGSSEPPPMPRIITEDAPEDEAGPTPAAAGRASGDSGSPASAEDVMEQLLQQEQTPPLIEPTVRPGSSDGPRTGPRAAAPTTSVSVDPAVLGIAPNPGSGQRGEAPTLRREGEFIVSRRGRLVRSPDGAHMLFVFDAESEQSPETPLIILPSQMLQSMEEIVQQRGDRVVFILSGQITTYRGANYVLPTMMKLALDRGNLQP